MGLGVEFGPAIGGDREQLLGALRLLRRDLPHVVEQGQGRIDDAGARGIGAAGQLLDPADQVISVPRLVGDQLQRSEEHTSELQSLMRLSYAVFCLKTKKNQ